MYIIRTIILRWETTSMLGDKTFFLFLFKDITDRFLFLSCGGSLFHLIVDAELNFFLSYLMQWVGVV